MTSLRLRATLTVLGASALLAGCGSDGAADTPLSPNGVVRVMLGEYVISPGKIKVVEGQVEIDAQNDGKLPHNVKVIDRTHKDGGGLVQYGGTDTVQPGASGRKVIRLFPGHYRLADTLASNENLGMYAELYVVPRGS